MTPPSPCLDRGTFSSPGPTPGPTFTLPGVSSRLLPPPSDYTKAELIPLLARARSGPEAPRTHYTRTDFRSASSLADRITTEIESAHSEALRAAGLMGLVPMALGEDIDPSHMPRPRGGLGDEMFIGRAEMVAAVRQWRRTKVAYDLDPDLSESLVDMEVDTEFPGEVLRHLPHPDPLFMLRRPAVVADSEGAPSEVLGFLVVGRPALRGVCSTSEITDDTPMYLVSALVRPAHGRLGSVLLFANAAAGTTTVSKMVDDSVSLTELAEGGPRSADTATLGYVRRLAVLVISHMLYMCSDRPDVMPTPSAAPMRGRHNAKGGRPATVYQVGWRLGPAIAAFNSRVARLREHAVALGGSVLPHIRRGHPHTFLHGPGRIWKKVRWVAPTLVNAAAFGDVAQGVIIPVF
ncbi:hypothetical protein OIU91_42420 (plasmid) [Streptomyces sp. NBC_01456]|uniref:hypothetical protein n=1 Tax=unclassified Streptomyces TaxID=2593676 RepID=UPI002E320485|nr:MULTISPECIES: hypothetical protein [unclassified Streptomyces]